MSLLEFLNWLGMPARLVHLAAGVALVGTSALLLLAGRSLAPAAVAWQVRMLRWSRWLALAAILGGLGTLIHQVAVLEADAGAILDPSALGRFLFETQAGIVWLARHGLLVLLAAFLACRFDLRRRADWLVGGLQILVLGLSALGLLAVSGHAAAVEPGAARAIGVDVLHLFTAGIWAGGLPALGALLWAASRADGADPRAWAARAARRFSRTALVCVAGLFVTGTVNAVTHVRDAGGLMGTSYGRMLLLKLALIGGILAVAAFNRRRLLPSVTDAANTDARGAMTRLQRAVTLEGALLLAVLAVVAVMSVTPPGRHQAATWPLPIRMDFTPVIEQLGATTQVLLARIAVIATAAVITWWLVRGRRRAVTVTAAALVATGAIIMLSRMTIDAYPTTFVRPAVPYTASSILSGARLYGEHCAGCHGPSGAGEAVASPDAVRARGDLRSAHVAQHTAGDLFWWITHGLSRFGMPAFGARLTDERRWDVVNFIRALRAADDVRQLGPRVEPEPRSLVAPDFTFSVGPSVHSLRDYRGERMVLVVLYTLPESRPRLAELALGGDALELQDLEIIFAPTDADPDAIRRLGPEPRLLFPVVTRGAGDIVQTYQMFARGKPHAEFLIDFQGYLRAWWTFENGASRPIKELQAEVLKLRAEKEYPPAAEHVH